ncbi:Variant surface glycoprotein [Trypanosoma congolense IL3000]|uniref:Variant surface glycoprotein n=1 Tax=Trypanosoma congolense (strain IL3000) TaxID=1068625 RepID=F9WE10_TRYCI|nr:Variant surface glycoprotein [Trypanosoma congolense IL3000]
MIMINTFLLVALVFCVGLGSAQPSAAEFNLFCRILAEANDMMYGPGYVYDENADRDIVKEMEVLYNATTANMKDFGNSLWDTKEFLKEHPPPMNPQNREDAHREIDKLIKEGEKKIEENKKIAEGVNKEINSAKLSVAQGIFGDEVKELPKQDGNLTKILNNTGSIFNHHESPSQSCGDGNKETGKTLLNDFFCVCVGDGDKESAGPCSPHILPSKHGNESNGGWKKMKIKSGEAFQFNESFKHIEKVCTEELVVEKQPIKNMDALLDEYVGMIGAGPAKEANGNKIFGHRGRGRGHDNANKVTKCDGTGSTGDYDKADYHNENICVDYTNHTQDGINYNIPWHNKFKSYTDFMKEAKKLEDQILKNRAALLLLKTEAWLAYSREKDDETSNLDDMNISNLLDGTQLPSFSLLLSYLSIFF